MTNEQIIFDNSIALMKEGKLQSIGKVDMIVTNEQGEEEVKKIDMPEPIHTFKGWKERGYVVRKGEKAIAAFVIWKHTSRKNDNDEEEGRMFMKKAHFFKASQVEKLA